MGVRKSAAVAAGRRVGPQVGWSLVRSLLDRSVDGVGPLRSAPAAATARLVDADGDVEKAITALVRHHTALAGAQGFVTNLGGVAALAVAVPANVAGVLLVQCHLVAGIAHLRGYDLDDPRVRNAVAACLLGEDTVDVLVRKGRLPSTPMVLATAPVHDPQLDRRIATEVATELITRTLGRRAVSLLARRVPVVGGVVAGTSDSWSTHQLGSYASAQLPDRRLAR